MPAGSVRLYGVRDVRLNVITIAPATVGIVDAFEVVTNVPKRERYEPASYLLVENEAICSAAATWEDKGVEIDATGHAVVNVWWALDVNDSTGNELRVVCRPVTGGANHHMPDADEYLIDMGNADDAQVEPFYVGDAYPYLQVQTRAAVLGASPATVTMYVTFADELAY